MSRFYPNGNDLIPKLSTWKPKILSWWNNTGSITQCLQVDNTGNVSSINTVLTSISVGDFSGAYAGLATESNWVNNFNNTIAGSSGDCHFGSGTSGCIYYCYYGQSGWNRWYTNNIITNSTLTTALQNTSNWPSTGSGLYNASSGDLGQVYYDGVYGYEYDCINGINHTWVRYQTNATYTLTSDSSFLPLLQIEVGKLDTNTFIIPAKYDIINIIVEAETTTIGNLSIGSSIGLSDIVPLTSLPTVIGTKLRLIYYLNVNYPTLNDRTMYININSAASVKLYILKQKMLP